MKPRPLNAKQLRALRRVRGTSLGVKEVNGIRRATYRVLFDRGLIEWDPYGAHVELTYAGSQTLEREKP